MLQSNRLRALLLATTLAVGAGGVAAARQVATDDPARPDDQRLTALQTPPGLGGPGGERHAQNTPPPVPGVTGAHPLPPQGGPDAPPPVPDAAPATTATPDGGTAPTAPKP